MIRNNYLLSNIREQNLHCHLMLHLCVTPWVLSWFWVILSLVLRLMLQIMLKSMMIILTASLKILNNVESLIVDTDDSDINNVKKTCLNEMIRLISKYIIGHHWIDGTLKL